MRIFKLMGLNKKNMMVRDVFNFDDVEDEEGRVDRIGNFKFLCLEIGVILFKEKLIGVLKFSGFEDKRFLKLFVEELLYLFFLFN